MHPKRPRGPKSEPEIGPDGWAHYGARCGRGCVRTAAATPAVRAEITTWERAEESETALLPAPFWCTYAWNRPTSTGAGGSDALWLCWRGKP
jgi:hypothetical protein